MRLHCNAKGLRNGCLGESATPPPQDFLRVCSATENRKGTRSSPFAACQPRHVSTESQAAEVQTGHLASAQPSHLSSSQTSGSPLPQSFPPSSPLPQPSSIAPLLLSLLPSLPLTPPPQCPSHNLTPLKPLQPAKVISAFSAFRIFGAETAKTVKRNQENLRKILKEIAHPQKH